MTLPNCKYCGKFCNPNDEGVVSQEVYGFMGIDDISYYHKKCKLNSEQEPERSVANPMPKELKAGKQNETTINT